ncbi:urease accessory protein [Nitrosomonas cryotolerans]|uniref:Urease accessory protein UreD n=1 Tax=Nitrosomonas cryotolerans ATCC 49181 TaxID=1131553 RepID=A0A1N6HWM2_9PROT|nr:urease accessory protein UreD [Nitrosomonas cryotolerans]SFP69545.1 urease accessory protein [Nitrosomonas cryotolerans]SIO24212.1 urease accessory protein [Nitrosomonas cryotolerans ATCC 49181]
MNSTFNDSAFSSWGNSTVSTDHLFVQKKPTEPISSLPVDSAMQARLSLKFKEDNGVTRLVGRDHFGQLYVQKPFYPEGSEMCQVVIVHPPGGVVGGDELKIVSQVGAAAKTQMTTPGAAKWYKGNNRISRQQVRHDVETGGSLEWLPQESIFFNQAHVELDHCVTLAKESTYIGCEILCFGRTASGESFDEGEIKQRTSIRRADKLIWFEQLRLSGGSRAMSGPLMLAGKTVCATLIAVGEAIPPALITSMREEASVIAGGIGDFGVTQLKSVVVVRYLGNSSEIARRIMLRTWGVLRPAMLGRQAIVPRMWNT